MRQLVRFVLVTILIALVGCSKKNAENGAKETGDADSQVTTEVHGSDTTTSDGDSHTDTSDGKSDTGTGDSAHDDTSSPTDEESSDLSSDSVDSATADSDTAPPVQYGEPELLYDLSNSEGDRSSMFHMEVDDSYVYFSTSMTFFRADKNGGGDPEVVMGTPLMGGIHQNLYVDSDAIYWVSNSFLRKLDKETNEETSLSYMDDGEEMEIQVLTLDEDRIYLAGPGCVKIISISKDGGDRIVSERPVEGEVGPITTLALDENYVYCGGGSRGPNMGKLFRSPKEGGEIEEVTTVPEATDPNSYYLDPQVSGMEVVDNRVYFISNFNTGVLVQYLGWAPTSGGEYTRIAELKGISSTNRLFYDEKRKALFFLAQGDTGLRGVYKYDLAASDLSYLAVTESVDMPMAVDEDYVYWHTLISSQIYRMKKF